MLKNYKGNLAKLGSAEQFLLRLLALPGYALRIKASTVV